MTTTTDTTQIAASLDSVEGWKRINKRFLFLFGGGAKSFSRWQNASEKAVVPNYLLVQDEHEGFDYFIHAFSTKGAIEPEVLEELRRSAADFELGTMRYESSSYSCLSPWRGQVGSTNADGNSIASLSRLGEGLFVYPLADDKDSFPLVAYARVGDEDMIFPIAKKYVD